ncbi:MAG: DUF6607 family protein [Bacteroidota bacterium]|nr:DUF6607 family protein [Bacteroidota bacterium]MEC9065329.1 DUF6607 family protein [Bacteroidota bacterium]|tara:strand:+ start:3789 stop:4685 length:897 start_codon:yes stop_codon:yes gene_type:complete
MKSFLLKTVFVLMAINLNAQSKLKKDIASIKQMCGCFEVTFEFSETFIYSKDSLYQPSKNKTDRGLEWAQLVVDEKDRITIQHILQVGDSSDPYIVKHWRQDWLYQNQEFYYYDRDNNWKYVKLPKQDVKGQWTQKVFQVDDSPRYEGSSSWVHIDGKSYWENYTDAPLPRRERTIRSDYNVLNRGNRHEIKEIGWVHDQNNKKIVRSENKDLVIAMEKGYNTYRRVEDEKCSAASNWWEENNEKWELVRLKWDEVFSRNRQLSLKSQVDDKPLFMYLFTDDYNDKNTIESIIDTFVK